MYFSGGFGQILFEQDMMSAEQIDQVLNRLFASQRAQAHERR